MKIVKTNFTGDFDTLMKKLELRFSLKLHAELEDEIVNGHISQFGNKVWIFIYETDGIHESESRGKTVTIRSSRVKRPLVMPRRDQVESVI